MSASPDPKASLAAYFSVIMDIADDTIIVTDNRQIVVFFNRAAELTFGYSADEIIGQSLDRLLPPQYVTPHQKYIQNFMAEPVASRYMHQRSEIYGRRKDGHEFPAEASISKLEREGGMLLVVILRDITQRKEQERQLEATFNKQKEMNDLKTRLISVVSHELRTPLAIIQSSTELLERYEGRLSAERRQECYQHITQQVAQLTDLIEDSLAITQLDNGDHKFSPQSGDLVSFCAGFVNNFELIDNGNHHFQFGADGIIEPVLFDKKLLTPVLNNVLANAIEYSPQGTSIQVYLSADPEHILVQIRDAGIGIPEADQKHIFENFYRGSNAVHIRGIGLGLAIALQAARAHGGDITFESEEGVGTTFIVTLLRLQAS